MTLRKQILIGAATMLCVAVPGNAVANPHVTTTEQTNDRRNGQNSDDDSQIKGNEDIMSDAHDLQEMDETDPTNDETKVRGRQ